MRKWDMPRLGRCPPPPPANGRWLEAPSDERGKEYSLDSFMVPNQLQKSHMQPHSPLPSGVVLAGSPDAVSGDPSLWAGRRPVPVISVRVARWSPAAGQRRCQLIPVGSMPTGRLDLSVLEIQDAERHDSCPGQRYPSLGFVPRSWDIGIPRSRTLGSWDLV